MLIIQIKQLILQIAVNFITPASIFNAVIMPGRTSLSFISPCLLSFRFIKQSTGNPGLVFVKVKTKIVNHARATAYMFEREQLSLKPSEFYEVEYRTRLVEIVPMTLRL